jgi:hypothetical protein
MEVPQLERLLRRSSSLSDHQVARVVKFPRRVIEQVPGLVDGFLAYGERQLDSLSYKFEG